MPESDELSTAQRLTTVSALSVGLLLTLLAIIGLWVGGEIEQERWRGLILSISSALLSIGVVGVMYDLLLRRTVSAELLRLVGIEKSIVSHQLEWVGGAGSLDWAEILGPASKVQVLMANPGSWVQQHIASLMRGARERAIAIELIFPDPDGDWLEKIASFENLSSQELRDSITRALTIVESHWSIASDRNELSPGCEVAVRYVDRFPTYNLVRADEVLALMLFQSTSHPLGDNGFAIRFRGAAARYPIDWYHRHLEELMKAPPQFTNRVEHRR